MVVSSILFDRKQHVEAVVVQGPNGVVVSPMVADLIPTWGSKILNIFIISRQCQIKNMRNIYIYNFFLQLKLY